MTYLTDFQQKTAALLPTVELRMNELLSGHTSFRIGGPAEVMAFPKNREELGLLLEKTDLLDCKPLILGAGTNILAPDEGVKGIVICLKYFMDEIVQIEDCKLRVGAGVSMTKAAVYAANLGLSGLEFAHGIPGSVGGGVYMNAGAYGGEICGVCESVELMDESGKICVYTAEEMEFSYRHSCLAHKNLIVVSAVFALQKKPVSEIQAQMRELMQRRRTSQPLDLPSAGSAFKRPAGGYAAALIDQAGLKGYRVGGAGVSDKHAGFAVNLGGATAEDVKNLLSDVADKVYAEFGIQLEPEIRIW